MEEKVTGKKCHESSQNCVVNYTEDVTRTKFAINRKSNCFGNLKSPTADHEENLIEIVLALSNNNLAHYNLFKHSVDVDRMEVFCITQKLEFFRRK